MLDGQVYDVKGSLGLIFGPFNELRFGSRLPGLIEWRLQSECSFGRVLGGS